MKIRSNLQVGASLCPQANLWRRRAEAAAETLLNCKKAQKPIPYPYYNPVYVNPTLPIGGGTTGSYDGHDYSGYCG